MDKKAKNIATAIVLIGFPIITTILALMISNLEKQTSKLVVNLLLCSIIFLLPFFLLVGGLLFVQIASPIIEDKIAEEINDIQEQSTNKRIIDGIYKGNPLALMDRTTIYDEIWLISPDLLTEISNEIYTNIVSDNLKKGTKYKYFVPNTPTNKARVKIFTNKCNNNNNNLEVYYLDDDFFFIVPHVDFAIYEPMKSVSEGKKGYIGLPLEGTNDSFSALMNNDFVDAVIGKLTEKIKSTDKSHGLSI